MTVVDPSNSGSLINPVEKEFIEKIGVRFEKLFGIPRIGGRILGLLFISAQPSSIDRISKSLLVSHGSICTNLRLLILEGLIQKVTFLGARRDYYQITPNLWEQIRKRIFDAVIDLKEIISRDQNIPTLPDIVRQRIGDWNARTNYVLQELEEAEVSWQEKTSPTDL